jgi:hypothetical protein
VRRLRAARKQPSQQNSPPSRAKGVPGIAVPQWRQVRSAPWSGALPGMCKVRGMAQFAVRQLTSYFQALNTLRSQP